MDAGMKRRKGHLSKRTHVPTIVFIAFCGVFVTVTFFLVMLAREVTLQPPKQVLESPPTVVSVGSIAKGGGSPIVDISSSASNTKTTLVECTISTPAAPASDANGVLHITVRHDLSPIASAVFLEHVTAEYYDNVFIFRVLKGFIAQWGFRDYKEFSQRTHKDIPSNKTKDVVHENTLSNVRATLSFAGGNPATRQVFVNFGNNKYLDKENSHPFATLDEGSMAVLEGLCMDYKDGQGQIKALQKGEQAFLEKFPKISKVEKCRVASE